MAWSTPALEFLRRIPPSTRGSVRNLMGAGIGSGGSHKRKVRLAAASKKPLVLVPAVAEVCRAVERPSLDGARVLQFGGGYLLAEPLIYTLLGADEVTAVDTDPLLQSKLFRDYAMKTDWPRIIESTLPDFDPAKSERWLKRLRRATQRANDDWYRDLGIRYLAPYDLLADNEPRRPYDLIVSQSALEHTRPASATVIFDRLTALLAKDGRAHHDLNLEDHRNPISHPFAFLGAADNYEPDDYHHRGNRLRASDWWQMCAAQQDMTWRYEASEPRLTQLPNHLAPAYADADPYDLAIGHLTLIGQRLPPQPLPADENTL